MVQPSSLLPESCAPVNQVSAIQLEGKLQGRAIPSISEGQAQNIEKNFCRIENII